MSKTVPSEAFTRVIVSVCEFLEDWRKGDINLSTLAALDAQSIEEALTELGAAMDAAPSVEPDADRVEQAAPRDIYVPGVWQCPKCVFRLVQSNLNARDGTVTPRDNPGDKCPNCNSSLWRVSWKDEAKEAYQIAENQMTRALEAEAALAEARATIAAMGDRWRTDEKPKTGEWITVRAECTYRWLPYKPGAPQRKHGKMGRWQEADEYGFKNCPEPFGDWRPSPPIRSALQGDGHDD
ncbi:hypothetical protein [Amorphus sp. MBR-141]